jgi:hypothetical protein
MDEKTKKNRIQECDEQIKVLNKMIEPFQKEKEKLSREIDLLKRLKNVGDTITWTDHYGTHGRDEDYYSAKILEVEFPKSYRLEITEHTGDSVRSFKSKEIGKIIRRGI